MPGVNNSMGKKANRPQNFENESACLVSYELLAATWKALSEACVERAGYTQCGPLSELCEPDVVTQKALQKILTVLDTIHKACPALARDVETARNSIFGVSMPAAAVSVTTPLTPALFQPTSAAKELIVEHARRCGRGAANSDDIYCSACIGIRVVECTFAHCISMRSRDTQTPTQLSLLEWIWCVLTEVTTLRAVWKEDIVQRILPNVLNEDAFVAIVSLLHANTCFFLLTGVARLLKRVEEARKALSMYAATQKAAEKILLEDVRKSGTSASHVLPQAREIISAAFTSCMDEARINGCRVFAGYEEGPFFLETCYRNYSNILAWLHVHSTPDDGAAKTEGKSLAARTAAKRVWWCIGVKPETTARYDMFSLSHLSLAAVLKEEPLLNGIFDGDNVLDQVAKLSALYWAYPATGAKKLNPTPEMAKLQRRIANAPVDKIPTILQERLKNLERYQMSAQMPVGLYRATSPTSRVPRDTDTELLLLEPGALQHSKDVFGIDLKTCFRLDGSSCTKFKKLVETAKMHRNLTLLLYCRTGPIHADSFNKEKLFHYVTDGSDLIDALQHRFTSPGDLSLLASFRQPQTPCLCKRETANSPKTFATCNASTRRNSFIVFESVAFRHFTNVSYGLGTADVSNPLFTVTAEFWGHLIYASARIPLVTTSET